ncbi:MAG: hypothetical protein HYT64_02855 [Candidatus Yanofskybacteria bacterium]|nr:hypothetical protein [Candidatus Yanofskybacteria bacterium]
MRYKDISLAIAVLLIATQTHAQQKSYIVVETPKTAEPTTVITGQPFTQTYVVRFIDLTASNERIIIQEESLKSNKALGDFEILDFRIDKQTKQREFLEHIWYLRYTLNIVNPKKRAYVIPPIEVPWKHKKAGQEEDDPSIPINSDFKTEEVYVTYVTTIPVEDPYLEIRDEINFGNFEKQAWIWWVVSWFLRVVPAALWLIALVVLGRSLRKELKIEGTETVDKVKVGEEIKNLSVLRAWFNLRMSIKHLKNCQAIGSGHVSDCLRAETEVVTAIKEFLRVKIPQLGIGSTPLTMMGYISKNMDQSKMKKKILLQLIEKAVIYQACIEKGADGYSRNPRAEAAELRYILGQLKFHRRAIVFVQDNLFKAKNRLTAKLQKLRGKR